MNKVSNRKTPDLLKRNDLTTPNRNFAMQDSSR